MNPNEVSGYSAPSPRFLMSNLTSAPFGIPCGNANWNNCKSILDRDLNAAINIKKYSLKSVLPGIGRENQKELPTLVGVMTSEVK
jgi:hypothetical protein